MKNSRIKVKILINILIGMSCILRADSLDIRVTSNTESIRIESTEVIDGIDSTCQEVVILNRLGDKLTEDPNNTGSQWQIDTSDDSGPSMAQLKYQDIVIDLLNGDVLSLSGRYRGILNLTYKGGVLINKDQTLNIDGDMIFHGLRELDNQGTLMVSSNLSTVVSEIKNSGKISIGRAWADFVATKFDNASGAVLALQRADFMYPSSSQIENRGKIGCVGDWNAPKVTLTNTHGGWINIGGNCELGILVNTSEQTPELSGFIERSRIFKDAKGQILRKPPETLTKLKEGKKYEDVSGEMKEECDKYMNYKRILSKIQKFKSREGRRSVIIVHRTLNLKNQKGPTKSYCSCSNILVGGDLNCTELQLKGYGTQKKEVCAVWEHEREKGPIRTKNCWFHHKYYDHYFFVDQSAPSEVDQVVAANLEVVGAVKGKITNLVNGVSNTERSMMKKQPKSACDTYFTQLKGFVYENGVLPEIDWEVDEYQNTLAEIKSDPQVECLIRLQQRKIYWSSNVPSAIPSRPASPGPKYY